MKKIVECAGRPLRWQQAKLTARSYLLLDAGETVATLRVGHGTGSPARAESAAGTWHFERFGALKPKVRIQDADGAAAGTFEPNTWQGGGTLVLPDTRRLLVSTNLWQTRHAIAAENGDELIRFSRVIALKESSDVEILPTAAALAELPWLVALGWYLALMMEVDSSVAVVA